MIIVKTKMKKLPETCSKCKFGKTTWTRGFGNIKTCVITNKDIDYDFSPEKGNWCYVKPEWCPLVEVSNEEIKNETVD